MLNFGRFANTMFLNRLSRIFLFSAVSANRIKRMDTSVIHQGNGKLGMYLNIPIQCVSVYDQFIAQLQSCRNGEFLGDERLDHGCLVQMSLSAEENQCIYDDSGNVRRYEEEPSEEFSFDFISISLTI